MNSPAVDIASILAADSGLALTLGDDLHVSWEPDSPDALVAIYDSGGFDPDPSNEYVYDRPTVQIRVRGARGTGFTAAYAQAESIRDLLHAVNDESWGLSDYIMVMQTGSIMLIERDNLDRPVLSMNFQIHRTEA